MQAFEKGSLQGLQFTAGLPWLGLSLRGFGEETLENLHSKKVVVIGGGPAGLTAAHELSKAGVESLVLEKDHMVGGLSRTVNYKDYYFDMGGHRFFTKVASVDRMWKELLGEHLLRLGRLSRIYYNNKYFYYPLRPLNALLGLGIWNSFLIMASYVYSHLFPTKTEETFEEWVSNRFGKRLYRTFFKTYTEKVWGISCREIRAEWAAQRIKGLSLLVALKNALIHNAGSNGKDPKSVVKTLIDAFDYPKFGPGMMWREVSNVIQRNGSAVWLDADVEGILWAGNRVAALEVRRNGQTELVEGTDFISSMPIRELVQKFKPSAPDEVLRAANDLKYRDFLTTALIVNKREVFPDNWIYIHDPKVKVGRIQNYKNWSPFMVPDPEKTCLGLEYFCFEGDDFWTMPDDELIELGKRELETLGLINKDDVVEDGKVVRMPKAYPIYDSTYEQSLEVIRGFMDGIENIQLIGRNGMHKYNNQDHSMLTAMLAAKNVLGANHDIWQVNTDQEYHEEITAEESQRDALERLLAGGFSRLDKLGFATALGSTSGLLLLIATLFLVLTGEPGNHPFQLLTNYFFGYSVTIKGAFVGLVYGFSWGFLFGWSFAYLRNLCLAFYIYRARKKVEMLSFLDFLDHF